MATVKIIEYRNSKGMYDLNCQRMIIEHEKHGRLLLSEAFGGMDSLEGGQYRWSQGTVNKLKPEDTFESLENAEWNENTSVYDAAIHGYDKSRPVLDWDGHIITAIAKKAMQG